MGIRSDGSDGALPCAPLPQIAGMPAICLQRRLLAFGVGLRPGALMRHVARDLSETQSPRWARSCAVARPAGVGPTGDPALGRQIEHGGAGKRSAPACVDDALNTPSFCGGLPQFWARPPEAT